MRALATALTAGLLLIGAAAAAAGANRTGQSPACERFCVAVEPRVGPEDSVFRFRGRGWRPQRRVVVYFGLYCRPDQACPAIAQVARLRTDRRGRFTFRLRAGAARPGDEEERIASGRDPTFQQRVGRPGERRWVSRSPRYRVILPD